MAVFFSKTHFLGQVTLLSLVYGQGIPDQGTPTELELSQGTVKGYIEPSLGTRVVQSYEAYRSLFINPVIHGISSRTIVARN